MQRLAKRCIHKYRGSNRRAREHPWGMSEGLSPFISISSRTLNVRGYQIGLFGKFELSRHLWKLA
jgi:hypothetical protein